MCGIVGVIAKRELGVYQKDIKMFKQLLYADQFRGTDGTGFFAVNAKNVVDLEKEPQAAHYFLFKKNEEIEATFKNNNNILIGHNRAATKGKSIKENTHPFKEGHITLVHNGTLWTHKHLKDVEVDSHAICHAFAEQGHEKALQEIDGAFALVWYNQRTKRLYLTRNSERPLTIVELKDSWLISSELGLAKWIAERNDEKILQEIELEEEMLYSFDVNNTSKLDKRKVKFKPKSWKSKSIWPAEYVDSNPYKPKTTAALLGYSPVVTLVGKGEYGEQNIPFIPVEIDNTYGATRLVGVTELDDTIEVVVYGKQAELEALLQEPMLVGKINYRQMRHNGELEEWVMQWNSVFPAKVSGNNEVITKEMEDNIHKCECSWCRVPLQGLPVEALFVALVDDHGNSVIEDVYCDECSPYVENAMRVENKYVQ